MIPILEVAIYAGVPGLDSFRIAREALRNWIRPEIAAISHSNLIRHCER